MTWRLAKSLVTLRNQVNELWPDRPKQSDGTIGDAAHSSRTSDHNPNSAGVVRAFDITAPVGHDVVERIRLSQDERVLYMISNGRICSSYDHADGPAWTWRPYSGSNQHTKHAHISVKTLAAYYDDPSPWRVASTPRPGTGVDTEEDMTPEQDERLRNIERVLLNQIRPAVGRNDQRTKAIVEVLGSQDVSAVADLVVAELGEGVAREVAAELHRRLAS